MSEADLSGELGFDRKEGFPAPTGMGFTSFAVWRSVVQCGAVWCSVVQCDLSGELGFDRKGGFPAPIGMGFTSFAVWCGVV